ncbi:hypothetical protein V5O48_013605 [Marasmius crinis-equi]|uniref:Uncharacterized protein n=1 Tax=Marasmius crinis-equi TaxID=585013 RepID=A0ABR3EZL2_9AGAR
MVIQDFKLQTVEDIRGAELDLIIFHIATAFTSERLSLKPPSHFPSAPRFRTQDQETSAIVRQLKIITLVGLLQMSILPWLWVRWMSSTVR